MLDDYLKINPRVEDLSRLGIEPQSPSPQSGPGGRGPMPNLHQNIYNGQVMMCVWLLITCRPSFVSLTEFKNIFFRY